MDEPTKDLEMLDKHVNALIEHYDSVQIFVTRKSDKTNGTIHVQLGEGNWFARYGQVREWIIREEENSRASARESREEG